MSRLLAIATDPARSGGVAQALAREARTLFDVAAALVVEVEDAEATVVAGDPAPAAEPQSAELSLLPAVAELLDQRLRVHALEGQQAQAAADALGCDLDPPARSTLLLPLGTAGETRHVLALIDGGARSWEGDSGQLAGAFATAAAAALAQVRLGEEHATSLARQAALTRAAKTLNESLDLPILLARICHEAATILDGDVAAVYRGDADSGLTIAATWGLPPETVGKRMEPGAGLSGRVVQSGRPMLSNDYQRLIAPTSESPFTRVESCLAVPMQWDSALRGVISVGFERPHRVGPEDLKLLETFGELAAVACANASAHAGLAVAARTDSLTGCLNHAALREGLAREIGRCERGAASALSLILLDLDDFKRINEEHGHLLGDEVLRRVGRALRNTLRPYDLAARYGGDEFAVLVAEADEAAAVEIARRAIDRLSETIGDVGDGPTAATAGVAEWSPGVSPTELIARADRALLFGKQEGTRGAVQAFTTAPDFFRPGRFARREDPAHPAAPPDAPASAHWPEPGAAIEDRLRRRSRQLALANTLGARLAAMTGARTIVDAAAEELHSAFEYELVAVVRCNDDLVEAAALRGEPFVRLGAQEWSQARDRGLIGRCLRERRPVLSNDVHAEPDYVGTTETQSTASELVVPVWVQGELWGAINIEDSKAGAFDEDDLRLVETVADQVGSALRSAFLYRQLERAYVETAEALATALEGEDEAAMMQTRSLVAQCEAVGQRMGMSDAELRDLRFGAVFHDIGKVAVPESILQKTGPLDADELRTVRTHAVVGERILMPVDFLAGARLLVRHARERWDGSGYPDGFAELDIPLGARIIAACDALQAMTTPRPYRAPMSLEAACAELRRCAGSQFDPDVVAILLELVENPGDGVTPAAQPATRPGT